MAEAQSSVGKSRLPEGADPYKILGVPPGSTPKEVESAYRKKSLKVHPDRNPDDPDAAQKFELLTAAKDVLLDPVLRAKLDAKAKFQAEKAARTAKMDGEKRRLREELEARENAAKRSKGSPEVVLTEEEEAAEREARHRMVEKMLRAENAKLLKQHEAEKQQKAAAAAAAAAGAAAGGEKARVVASWKGTVEVAAVRAALTAAGCTDISVDVAQSSATAAFASREQMLQAVLAAKQTPLLAGTVKLRLKPRTVDAPSPASVTASPMAAAAAEVLRAAAPPASPPPPEDFASDEARLLAALKARAGL